MKLLALLLASAFAQPAVAQLRPQCEGIHCMVAMSESKLDPCVTNIKAARKDPGGLSIGAYQMSSRYGNAQALAKYMAIDMTGIDPVKHADAWASRWTTICERNADYFLQEQTWFLLNEWPEWQRAERRYEALKGVSEPIKALALSVVVSHGYEGSKRILGGLRGPMPSLTEAELAYDISNKRACSWMEREGRFSKGWMLRADREYNEVLRQLGESPRVLEVSCGES